MKTLIFVILAASIASAALITLENGEVINDRPIIGVFSYPSEFYGTFPADEYNYVAASYIKWTEQAGARSMPIPYDLSDDEMMSMFSKVNGLLFPGGFWNIFQDMDNQREFTELAQGAIRMFKLALQANYDGDHFPIYGIQSGMQLILAALAADPTGEKKVFTNLNLINWAAPIEYMRNGTDELWSYQDQETMKFTKENKAAFYFSNFTVSVRDFLRSDVLRTTFDITAMSEDANGQKFVTGIQGKGLPIYGTQFFAQGNIFEWKQNLKMNHHPLVIDFQQQLANFFVSKSRKSRHDYKLDDDEDELLIYNFAASKISNDYFEQIYFFPKGEIQGRLQRTNFKLAMKMQQQQNE